VKSYTVIGYAADADIWCEACLLAAGYKTDGQDQEGNDVHPLFAGDENADEEHCGSCGGKLL
jgi:hypothetical protein